MPYNPKDYRTNRKAILMLRKKLLSETVTTVDAIAMGAKKTQLAKWVKDGNLNVIFWSGQNRYNKYQLKNLIIKSLK